MLDHKQRKHPQLNGRVLNDQRLRLSTLKRLDHKNDRGRGRVIWITLG